MSARYLTLSITPELAGAEVNTLLRRTLGLSGTVLRRIKWLEDGITLDGARVNVRVRVREGQTLAARLTPPAPASGVVPAEGQLFGTDRAIGSLLERLAQADSQQNAEFISIFYGEDVSEEQANEALSIFQKQCPNAEITLLSGGQPVYYYMISAE